ncbi:integrase catalytic domain-containing protein [Trichonephila clavipes]|nr:integrase catalytic domain-containing protein [Trichonephila clavipes]
MKRFILQAVGKIFDPLGLISPFTVRMKCFLQNLWKEEIQWEDPLRTHIEKEWKKLCEELPHLRNLKIPRLVLDSTLLEDDVELHSFCDASKKAYGAAIYLRTKSRNGISVKLVTSKSRVAPLNCVTLPRLELLGALVAAHLAFKGNKTRWKQFVANRVNEINSLTDPHSWYHYAGKENPADFLSRGLSADCLVSNSRWWTGAEFLSNSEFPKNFHERVNISSPITIAGLDLCGPFLAKYKNQRKGTLNKVYICVCICFSTKAIHLELLSDLTSDALIATLKRFTSRRDFGGLWEAGVKSVKHHLKRAIGNLHFTFEEFETIMIQAEGILNSRPLTPLSSDAGNFDVLSPGHFLIGRPITSIPEPNLIDVNENRLGRWELTKPFLQRICTL